MKSTLEELYYAGEGLVERVSESEEFNRIILIIIKCTKS